MRIQFLPICILWTLLSGCSFTNTFVTPDPSSGEVQRISSVCPYEIRGLIQKSGSVRVTTFILQPNQYGSAESYQLVLDVAPSDSNLGGALVGSKNRYFNRSVAVSVNEPVIHVLLPGNVRKAIELVETGRSVGYDSAFHWVANLGAGPIDSVSISYPRLVIDGSLQELGTLNFKKRSETYYALNC